MGLFGYHGTRILAGGLFALAMAACAGGAMSAQTLETSKTQAQERPAGAGLNLRLVRVAGGFSSPTFATAAPGQRDRLYVVEKPGTIRILVNGKLQAAPFLDIQSLVGSSGSEQGLLSVAFHSRFATNRLFYVDYTDTNGDTRVVEYRARAGGPPLRTRQLLFVDQPYANHNGGQLAFGPDGHLYVGMGDGGSGGDPQNHAQDLSSRLGKLLRLDVDKLGATWQLAGYGLRNPWRYSFDRKTGDLYIADVGQNTWEEIDFTARSSPGLENYGWRVYEGKHRYADGSPNPKGRLVFPIYEYSHDKGCSVTGGYVYRGTQIAAARGRYLFGDYCSGTVWSMVVRNGRATDVRRHPFTVGGLSSFGEGPGGELYLVSLEGTIYRLAPG